MEDAPERAALVSAARKQLEFLVQAHALKRIILITHWGCAFYAHALGLFGQVPTLIEWDTGIPSFAILEGEAVQAQRLLDRHSTSGVPHARVA